MLNVISGLLSGAGAPASTTSYESIATVTVGSGGSSSISFSSIPSTFKHLQIRATALMATSDTSINLQFNSDTGSNYSKHLLAGDGATASAYAWGGGSQTSIFVGTNAISYTNATAFVADVLEYANTNTYKTLRSLHGADKNGSGGYVGLSSGNWRNTSAVNAITIFPGAGNFNQYSSFALYGIKG